MFVSTMSVFAEADGPGIDEESPLVTLDDPTTEEVTGETYGGLKVLCARWGGGGDQVRRMHRFRRSMHAIRASGRSGSSKTARLAPSTA